MGKKLHENETDEEMVLRQGFKMGATAAFVAANYPLDDITDEILDNMYEKVINMYASRKKQQ